ncbi:MAG: hypothetical protein KDE53_26730, partial [Caldilineaceae bacterium]|nr:hypothetical protein [Caldilineaceae bacterium]
MKQMKSFRQLFSVIALLGLTMCLVGQPVSIDAQSAECLDSTNVVCVDAEGEVGISTTTPDAQLHVNIPNDSSGNTQVHFGNGEEGFFFYNSTVGGFVPTIWSLANNARTSLIILGGTTLENDTGNAPLIRIEGRRPDAGAIANRPILSIGNRNAHALVVNHNHNVGIGTLNPQVPLDVGGHGTVYATAWEKIVASDPDQAGISVKHGGKTLYLYNNGSELKLDAYDYAGESPIPLDIQVSSQGNVGIQTARPEAPLHLNTRANEQGLKITKDGKNTAIF